MNNYKIPCIKSYKRLIDSVLKRKDDILCIGDNFKIYSYITENNNQKIKHVEINPDMTNDNRSIVIKINESTNRVIVSTRNHKTITVTNITIDNINQPNEKQSILVEIQHVIRGRINENDFNSFTIDYGKNFRVVGNSVVLDDCTYSIDKNGNLLCNGKILDEKEIILKAKNTTNEIINGVIEETNNSNEGIFIENNNPTLEKIRNDYTKKQLKNMQYEIENIKGALAYLPYIKNYLLHSLFSKAELDKFTQAIEEAKKPTLQDIVPVEEIVEIINTCINSENTYKIDTDNIKVTKEKSGIYIGTSGEEKILIIFEKNKKGIVKNIVIDVYDHYNTIRMNYDRNSKMINNHNGIQKVTTEDFDLNNPYGGFSYSYRNSYPSIECQIISNDLEKMIFEPSSTKYHFEVDKNIIKSLNTDFIFNDEGELIKIRKNNGSFNKKKKDLTLRQEETEKIVEELLKATSDKMEDIINETTINKEKMAGIIRQQILEYQAKTIYPYDLSKIMEYAKYTKELANSVKSNATTIGFYKYRLKEALELIKEEEQKEKEKAIQYIKL